MGVFFIIAAAAFAWSYWVMLTDKRVEYNKGTTIFAYVAYIFVGILILQLEIIEFEIFMMGMVNVAFFLFTINNITGK